MPKNTRIRKIDFDQVISDSLASERFSTRETPLSPKITITIFVGALLLATIFLGRAAYLGLVKGEDYALRASSNVNQDIPLIAPRGIIFDRNGEAIVDNEAIFTAFLQLDEMIRSGEEEAVLSAAENILGLKKEELEKHIKDTNLEDITDVILKRELTRDEVIAIETLNLKSIIVERDFKRNYKDPAFSHLVGYVTRATQEDLQKNNQLAINDYVGKTGLEASYDDLLRGDNGSVSIYRNAKGDLEEIRRTKEPIAGDSLETTIDAGLQKYLHGRMVQGLVSLGRTSGAAIAINPENGEILALASFPSFDANNVSEYLGDPNMPLFNRAVSGLYSPGSTIKPVHAVSALAEGIMSEEDRVYSAGYIEIPNPYSPENPSRFLDWRPHGWVNVRRALAVSSNIYFYVAIGGFEGKTGVGIERLHKYWEEFGLGDKTFVDLPGEATGFLPTPEEKEERTGSIWRVGDTYNVSIGQGDFRITPLELINAISAIAEGKAYKLHIKESDEKTEIVNLSKYEAYLPAIRAGMRDVVATDYGSARSMSSLEIDVAAKTGTPQTTGNTKMNALIAAYAPYDDPQIVLLILIEDAVEGSLNAVPVAHDVLGWYYENRLK